MKRNNGFTLLELMIVVAIIAIIAAIAYPSYTSHMRESRRSEGKSALLRMADLQEKYYLQNNTYTGNAAQVGGTTTEHGYYTLSVTAANATAFTLQAVGNAQQAADQSGGTNCQTLTLNSASQKTPAACW